MSEPLSRSSAGETHLSDEAERLVPSAPALAILGVPFDNVTTKETVRLIEEMIRSGAPHYLATANVDFLVQALRDVELRRILFEAHLVICDGTPLVWGSRLLGNPLPERVAGADLVPLLVRLAEEKEYRVFFLGGRPEATDAAIAKLKERHPRLKIAGSFSPPYSDLLEMDHEEIRRRIAEGRPDILFVCFGCPKQEKWIYMHYRTMGVPVSIGVGGTVDFLAGRLKRAPRWMQTSGLEWVFRAFQEPRRLGKRYLQDLWSFGAPFLLQCWRMQWRRRKKRRARGALSEMTPSELQPIGEGGWQELRSPEWLDMDAVHRHSTVWEQRVSSRQPCFFFLNDVEFIDSTGVGFLIRLQKRARAKGQKLVLVSPSPSVQRALRSMRLEDFFMQAADLDEARSLTRLAPRDGREEARETSAELAWPKEVTAANAVEAWGETEAYLGRAAQKGEAARISLKDVSFIDSTGVSLMIRAKKLARQKELPLTFVGIRPAVRNVLQLSKLEAYLLNE